MGKGFHVTWSFHNKSFAVFSATIKNMWDLYIDVVSQRLGTSSKNENIVLGKSMNIDITHWFLLYFPKLWRSYRETHRQLNQDYRKSKCVN